MIRNLFAGKVQLEGLSMNIFTEDDLDQIHCATLEVLERTGLFIGSKEAREILDGGGAVVDEKAKTVKFPPYLVEDSIRSAPSKVLLAGRNPKNDIVLESKRVGFTNFGEAVFVIDPYTGERRETTKKDVEESARLIDYLDQLDVYIKAAGSSDAPMETANLHNAEAWMPNTSKHGFMGGTNGYITKKIFEIAATIVGGKDKLRERPILSTVTCPISPLQLGEDTCEIIMESARAGIMVNVLSMAMAGGSSPVTLAGTLVIHNAEVLGGLVLNQLTSKGAPFMYGSSTTAMDLRFASAAVGCPECAMINAAVAQMARYYLLPSWVAGG